MVELLASSLCLYNLTRQLDHVTYGKFTRLCTPIGVFPQRSGSLIPVLFQDNVYFHHLLRPSTRIRDFRHRAVGRHLSDAIRQPRVVGLFCIERRQPGRGMDTVVVGKFG